MNCKMYINFHIIPLSQTDRNSLNLTLYQNIIKSVVIWKISSILSENDCILSVLFCFCFSSLAFSQAFSVSRFFALYSAYWKHFSNDDEVRAGCKLLSQGSITNKQQFAGMEAELDWTNLCKFQDRRCTGTKAKKAPR